jgi:putative RecB family exonuclease
MALPVPSSLSPSRVSSFTDCALAFRFANINRIPEPPSVPATKGSLVHRALELLFCDPPGERTIDAALAHLETARTEFHAAGDLAPLGLDDAELEIFQADAAQMVRSYFDLEDPTLIEPMGIELKLEARIGELRLRGIIDRLERDADGRLIVTDYKTGRVPGERQERSKLGGVHFYAYMCEQLLGERPAEIRLLYLGKRPEMLVAVPTDQTIRALERKVIALWSAVERCCERDDFRPSPSKLCDWCSFQEWCPAFGGDPATAPMFESAVALS